MMAKPFLAVALLVPFIAVSGVAHAQKAPPPAAPSARSDCPQDMKALKTPAEYWRVPGR